MKQNNEMRKTLSYAAKLLVSRKKKTNCNESTSHYYWAGKTVSSVSAPM